MIARERYSPGPAHGAEIQKKDGATWGLILVRELRHAPEMVWEALTDPAQLSQWAPFDADMNLGAAGATGATVKLTTMGAPKLLVTETTVTKAEPPKLLVYDWGGNEMRWELESVGKGTRLTLWTSINRHFIAMGASGWHVCFDVLDRHLGGDPLGRIVGPAAMQVDGWKRLLGEYTEQFR